MVPAGDLQFRAQVKEPLVDEIREQTRDINVKMARAERITRVGDAAGNRNRRSTESPRTHNVIIAIGRSGNFRKLNVPGEESGKVFNRLHDPKEYANKDVLVVGGGDSALETSIAIAECGGRVTLSYRKPEFSRPKPDNIDKLNQLMADPMADVQVERPSSERVTTAMGDYMGSYRKAGSINLMLGSKVKEIRENDVAIIDANGQSHDIPNDTVFTMIGREAPLEFFRRSGIPIRGERNLKWWLTLAAFFLLCFWVYNWKSQYIWPGNDFHVPFPRWLDPDPSRLANLGTDPKTLLGTLAISASSRSFYYTLAYTTLITVFGIRRIRRRKTPYVTKQTLSLMLIQIIPLFILPEIVLPLLGHHGFFDSGAAQVDRGSTLSRRHLRSWSRILARVWVHPRLAAARAERVQRSPDVALADHFVRANVRADSRANLPLRQRRVLRLDLFLRRDGRDAGRSASPQDAARADVESAEHGGAGDPGVRVRIVVPAHRRLDAHRLRRAVVPLSERSVADFALFVVRRLVHRRRDRVRLLLPLQWPSLVPLRVSAGGADAHLRAIQPVPNPRG